MKTLVWGSIGFGLLVLLIGLWSRNIWVMAIGLLFLFGGIWLLKNRMNEVLSRDQIVDRWSHVTEGAQGHAEEIFGKTVQFLRDSQAPHINFSVQDISDSRLGTVTGNLRRFLIVRDGRANGRRSHYRVHITVRTYGNSLTTEWYLTYTPSRWEVFLAQLPYVREVQQYLSEMTLFDEQDLRDFTSCAHRCLRKAVEELFMEMGKDANAIPQTSRGLLGIS